MRALDIRTTSPTAYVAGSVGKSCIIIAPNSVRLVKGTIGNYIVASHVE